jgi:hypothetical protein
MGPVESIDVGNGASSTITVLGQTYRTTPDVAASFAVGDYVVAGGSGGDLSLIYGTQADYVAGSSQVTVRGAITSVDVTRALLGIGDVTIDYSSHLTSNASYTPVVGDVVEVKGTQPLSRGIVLALPIDTAVVTLQAVHLLTTESSDTAFDTATARE